MHRKSGEKIIPTSRPEKHPFKSANLLKENGTPATILKLLSYKKLMKTPRKVKNKSARTWYKTNLQTFFIIIQFYSGSFTVIFKVPIRFPEEDEFVEVESLTTSRSLPVANCEEKSL